MADGTRAGTTTQTTEVGGHRIAYRTIGDGIPVLMLHGWPLDGASFDALAAGLADRARCIMPDLPGAGESPADPVVPSPRGQARLIAQLLVSIGSPPAVVVGSDSGGMTGRWLAADRPDLVRGLVLLNTELPHRRAPHQRSQRVLARWLPGYTSVAQRLMRSPDFLVSPRGLGGTLHDHALLLGEFRRRWIDPLTSDRRRMDAARRAFVAVLDWRELDALAAAHREITAPTWLLWGEADRTFPLEHARQMSAGFPDLRGVTAVPNARLYVHLDQPEAVRRGVVAVLDELAADGTSVPAAGPVAPL